MSQEMRESYGITETLPTNPEEARRALASDALLHTRLGSLTVSSFLTITKMLCKILEEQGAVGSPQRQEWLSARM